MKKIVIITGLAAAAALLPAGIGLAANPSLSARVPVAPVQVQLATGVTTPTPARTSIPIDDKGGNRPAGVSDDGASHHRGDDNGRHSTTSPTGTATADDHGGNRPAGGSDDGATHDKSDDKGGATPTSTSSDDKGGSTPTATASDDKGGSGNGGSGKGGSSGKGGGSDDGSGHDNGDDKGGDS